ncbi:PIG-L deacetylase family protein [Geothrix sp. 21YS21S-2]|uniref:PIG-L deacetylase family protein n=1 Tax=Geothrix sp. 21YS21S-2 TaxID=3068893 RepID=UPI0027B8EA28|nr:PIG-L family deacetylase [Geothrix sp. 21YS21S-2]
MSHPYTHYVEEYVKLQEEARTMPLGDLAPAHAPRLMDNAPRVLVFAPHPDDESITGALTLRLRRELNYRVCVVAVTQGSRVDRQEARLQEMYGACHFLGFELITTRQNGLASVNPKTRGGNPDGWATSVETIAQIISYHRPSFIVIPHDQDWNSTHLGTHHLVVDALKTLGPAFKCRIVETEYWHPMADPNLMIQSTPGEVADLVAATSFHKGEVVRNPYHLTLPSWMSDNVRRGGEIVGGQGEATPVWNFASLYRVRDWVRGGFETCLKAGRIIPTGGDLAAVFKIQ